MSEVAAIDRPATKQIQARTLRKLRVAARMRASGYEWKHIAPQIGRKNAINARQLQTQYPELWHTELQKAVDRYRPQLEALAVNTLDGLLGGAVKRPVISEDGQSIAGTVLERTPLTIRTAAATAALTHIRQSKAQQVQLTANVAVLDTTALVELARSGTFASAEQIALAEHGILPAESADDDEKKPDDSTGELS